MGRHPRGDARLSDSRVNARAREDDAERFADFPEKREDRVRYVMKLMCRGSEGWETGKTGPRLAEATGVSLRTIESISAEASRRCKSAVDVGLVRQHLAVTLFDVIEEGRTMTRGQVIHDETSGKELVVPGDPKALSGIAACAKAYSALVGADAPKKHEVTGKDGAPLIPGTNVTITDLSEEQLKAFIERGEVPKPK